METITIRALNQDDLAVILPLTQQLNPNLTATELEARHLQLFEFDNYHCFGCYKDGQLIGLSGGWITVRLYSGKQLEIDHVIIDKNQQSNGIGQQFLALIEAWAIANNCCSIELNAYLQNDRSHKFYFKQGYKILGFHFQKQV